MKKPTTKTKTATKKKTTAPKKTKRAGTISVEPNWANVFSQFLRNSEFEAGKIISSGDPNAIHAARGLMASLNVALHSIGDTKAFEAFRESFGKMTTALVKRSDQINNEREDLAENLIGND